jgi:hypothetical protein
MQFPKCNSHGIILQKLTALHLHLHRSMLIFVLRQQPIAVITSTVIADTQ